MSTSSTIALEFADGSVQSVYCHSDGHLTYVGRVLQEHYKDPFKVAELIAHGGISMLGVEIGKKIDFDARLQYNDKNQALQCRFYTRDRGDRLSIDRFASFQEFVTQFDEQEYNYLLRPVNGKPVWMVFDGDQFVSLAGELEAVAD